tara:strand:+ start:22422 stop:23183 length:762 start_codon:yes stop_codon:yes gene_type:complete
MKFSNQFRSTLVVLASVVALGLASCSPALHSVESQTHQRGIDEPFFVQPERMAAKRAIIDSGVPIDLVFVGDSITQNYEKPEYQPVWQKFYGHRHALNLGYGMDTTGATLWRFRQGELKGLAPKVAVILVGTNDINMGRNGEDTAAGMISVVEEVKARLPQTQILLLAILPSGPAPEKGIADVFANLTIFMHYAKDPRVTLRDLTGVFIESDGQLKSEFFVEQPPKRALHPNPEGQAAMAGAIDATLERLLGE